MQVGCKHVGPQVWQIFVFRVRFKYTTDSFYQSRFRFLFFSTYSTGMNLLNYLKKNNNNNKKKKKKKKKLTCFYSFPVSLQHKVCCYFYTKCVWNFNDQFVCTPLSYWLICRLCLFFHIVSMLVRWSTLLPQNMFWSSSKQAQG